MHNQGLQENNETKPAASINLNSHWFIIDITVQLDLTFTISIRVMNKNSSYIELQPRRKFLKSWITPVIISVALPAHAAATEAPPEPNILFRDLKLGLQLHSCTSSIITVRICNNEPFGVEIIGAHVEEYPYHTGSRLIVLKAISHNQPFAIPKGECVTVTFGRKSNSWYWQCGSPWRLYVGGESQGTYGEYDSVRGGAYIPLRGDGTATSTPFTA